LNEVSDTIVALSSAPGAGGRAVVRLSGPEARRVVANLFKPAHVLEQSARRCHSGAIQLAGVNAPLPADLYIWAAPHSYTGQDVIELHTFSSPPLVDELVTQLLNSGCRAAQPGEFTMRAFLAGKLDLPRAEAVLGVIEASSREQLKQALIQLAGGISRPLHALRENLLDLLADVEAGLDFAEEDIQFVARDALLKRLTDALAQVTLVQKQLEQRAVSCRRFRVVLCGRPNVGKSSLFNALTGESPALVDPTPGTTRDYLVRTLAVGDVSMELVDTAGWQEAQNMIASQAQDFSRQQARQGDLLLLCLEAGQPVSTEEQALLSRACAPPVLGIMTKSDLAPALSPSPPPLSPEAGERGVAIGPSPTAFGWGGQGGLLATSTVTGAGLNTLRTTLAERARAQCQPPLAPSLSRCRHHVDACLGHLRQAHATVLFEEPVEVLALELRGALDELGEMVGAIYTDDLLDRIFSRFCIGK
jgi:tRNA modification GTPase